MLKAFQLRAARSACGIGVRDIGLYLKVSGTIVSRWEQKAALEDIKSNITNPEALIFFFEQYKISFPDYSSVKLNHPNNKDQFEGLTRFQLRAARAILAITQLKLSSLTDIPVSIINYLESQNNDKFLIETKKIVNDYIFKTFFEQNGIIFPNSFVVSIRKT